MRRKPAPFVPHPVDRPDQIRALASTVRQDIVDTVQALGSASVPELARHLSRQPDSLYYHVRALLKVGLLVRQPADRVQGGRSEAMYATARPDRRLQLAYPSRDGKARAALEALVGNMLRSAHRDFTAASKDPDCMLTGPRRALWAGRSKGWLSTTELERCNALLAELTGLLSNVRTPERDRLFTLQFLLAPARRRPEAPGDPATGGSTPRTSTRHSPRSRS
ncbi:MAG: helix-turn-helix transcriptional regulator [Xanthomonadales bacterium]|nr:helix-turn-helix transcriptional regulator [Xanthomonadales bacterium]